MTTDAANTKAPLLTEFLLLPDGRILVQNLTPVMAAILLKLNPGETAIRRLLRASVRRPLHDLQADSLDPTNRARPTTRRRVPNRPPDRIGRTRSGRTAGTKDNWRKLAGWTAFVTSSAPRRANLRAATRGLSLTGHPRAQKRSKKDLYNV